MILQMFLPFFSSLVLLTIPPLSHTHFLAIESVNTSVLEGEGEEDDDDEKKRERKLKKC
jgi:hypothetical protein